MNQFRMAINHFCIIRIVFLRRLPQSLFSLQTVKDFTFLQSWFVSMYHYIHPNLNILIKYRPNVIWILMTALIHLHLIKNNIAELYQQGLISFISFIQPIMSFEPLTNS